MRARTTPRLVLLRVRARLWPILQTAAAAVGAWYLAGLIVGDPSPSFAAIAAVISVGATYGERPARAIHLSAGVVVGISVADVLIRAIGTGPPQIGATVLLAMTAAVMLGGGPMVVTEAGVSAILLTSLAPATPGLLTDRPFEALIGGAVALAVSSLAFPPDPRLDLSRAANALADELGGVLEDLAAMLAAADRERADAVLARARGLDTRVQALQEAVALGQETARLTPWRRGALAELARYGHAARHLDFAVRNVRVLARHAGRFVRAGRVAPEPLADAIRALRPAVWSLAGDLEDPGRGSELRETALLAAARAADVWEHDRDLGLAEIVVQVRSAAVDLMRAAQGIEREPEHEAPTEELLSATA